MVVYNYKKALSSSQTTQSSCFFFEGNACKCTHQKRPCRQEDTECKRTEELDEDDWMSKTLAKRNKNLSDDRTRQREQGRKERALPKQNKTKRAVSAAQHKSIVSAAVTQNKEEEERKGRKGLETKRDDIGVHHHRRQFSCLCVLLFRAPSLLLLRCLQHSSRFSLLLYFLFPGSLSHSFLS